MKEMEIFNCDCLTCGMETVTLYIMKSYLYISLYGLNAFKGNL